MSNTNYISVIITGCYFIFPFKNKKKKNFKEIISINVWLFKF